MTDLTPKRARRVRIKADPADATGPAWLVARGTHTVLVHADEQDTAHDVGALRLAGYNPQEIRRRRGHDPAVIGRHRAETTCRPATPAEVEQVAAVLAQQLAGRDGCRTA